MKNSRSYAMPRFFQARPRKAGMLSLLLSINFISKFFFIVVNNIVSMTNWKNGLKRYNNCAEPTHANLAQLFYRDSHSA